MKTETLLTPLSVSRSLTARFVGGSIALLALSLAPIVSAATGGTDNASNYANTGWSNGSNFGTGFGAWTLTNNNDGSTLFAGNFIGDSTADGSGIGNINTAGVSFGLYANPNGAFINADRSFAGGALSVGQTFSLNLAINFRNGGKGLNLYASGTQIFNFNAGNPGAGDGYYYTVGSGSANNTGFAYYADSVFTLAYTQQSATAGLFTISRTSASGGATASNSVNVPITTSGVDSFRIYNSNGTNASGDNLYFNNLTVSVPEPTTWTLLVLGGSALVMVRRRQAL